MANNWFPTWRKRSGNLDGAIIAPDERLPVGATLIMGLQHAVAMFGATVLMPLLMGFDANLAILMSGIGTLLFFLIVGGRVPSYLGSSAAFVGLVIAVTGYTGNGPNPNIALALGGIIACGAIYTLIGFYCNECWYPLDRALNAAGGHWRGGDGHWPKSGSDCRE